MRKTYSKPEIRTDAYADFENVMTFACTKKSAPGCHAHPELSPGNGQDGIKYDPCTGIQLRGQSTFKATYSYS